MLSIVRGQHRLTPGAKLFSGAVYEIWMERNYRKHHVSIEMWMQLLGPYR